MSSVISSHIVCFKQLVLVILIFLQFFEDVCITNTQTGASINVL